jgi:AraC-like DNA-binding protein
VFAAKLAPGAAPALLGRHAHAFTDARVALDALVEGAGALTSRVLGAKDVAGQARALGDWLAARARPLHADAVFSAAVVEAMREDPSITSVALAAARFECSARTLQRLFRRWVGVSPKWVIARYRLHEAMEALERDPQVPLAELAHRLGYFDQSHFTRDFHALVGEPPARYARAFGEADGA